MASAQKFLFERDFRDPNGATVGGARHLAELAAAEERGFASGLAEGRRRAAEEAGSRLAETGDRLARELAGLLAGLDADLAALDEQALAFGLALGRKLAGEALREAPLAGVTDAARAALQHLRGVPHLAVRVNDLLVEEADTLMRRLAREQGFEGRVVVLGDPEIASGDARLEWADGGVVREQAGIDAAVARALRPAAGPFTFPEQ